MMMSDPSVAAQLVRAIESPAVHTVSVTREYVGVAAAPRVAEALRRTATLRSLSLTKVKLCAGMVPIFDAVAASRSLAALSIYRQPSSQTLTATAARAHWRMRGLAQVTTAQQGGKTRWHAWWQATQRWCL